MKDLKKVGYWYPGYESHFPKVHHFIDSFWLESEKLMVINYLEKYQKSFYEAYRGESCCRICGIDNGALEYSDGTYLWPEGFCHYIVSHNVKPPQDFIDHIINETLIKPLENTELIDCGINIKLVKK